MPLHRQVFWVGRQWAVTGHGMQAVDQKQKSKFDIEISRLWDDDLVEGLATERWFNLADFSEGLAIARARYPEPPGRPKPKIVPKIAPEPAPPREMVSPPKASTAATPLKAVPQVEPKAEALSKQAGLQPETRRQTQPRSEPRKLTPEADFVKSSAAKFAMRVDGGCARFTTMWRVRIRR
jgi:hypothetical protein